MSWNYRLVRYADGSGYGVHEVYYDDDGKPDGMTKKPAVFVGETEEEVRDALLMARVDIHKRPLFNEPDEWTVTDEE